MDVSSKSSIWYLLLSFHSLFTVLSSLIKGVKDKKIILKKDTYNRDAIMLLRKEKFTDRKQTAYRSSATPFDSYLTLHQGLVKII